MRLISSEEVMVVAGGFDDFGESDIAIGTGAIEVGTSGWEVGAIGSANGGGSDASYVGVPGVSSGGPCSTRTFANNMAEGALYGGMVGLVVGGPAGALAGAADGAAAAALMTGVNCYKAP